MMEQDNRNDTKLLLVKIVHTLIWAFFVGVIAYVVYAGLMDDITLTVWVAIGLVVLEGVLLLMNEGKCPLTSIARRYSDRLEDNFDIFLPNWLAKNNKFIFTAIFAIGVALVVWRVVG